MADICCGVVSENEASPGLESSPQRSNRRKRMELRHASFVDGVPTLETENGVKQARMAISPGSFSRECNTAFQNGNSSKGEGSNTSGDGEGDGDDGSGGDGDKHALIVTEILRPVAPVVVVEAETPPKFGVASVCGRRRDMEDTVAIHPSLLTGDVNQTSNLHYFAVYDGHGCSHVATRCKDRMHLLVKEELNTKLESMEWRNSMERSFNQMDKEITEWNKRAVGGNCRCELQAPDSDAVGSTAVVAITTPDKIIVANCGDSRAVLCRNGRAIPLSIDHKPDRPDELARIQAAGGRVIYWEGARVSGVLAMSRAIGDNYLKPYVICEPEVTITERTIEDECLIIATDGLWDVVSNETACGVARMCLKGRRPSASMRGPVENEGSMNWDKACSDASMLLTKLALARRTTDNVSVVVIDLQKK